MCGICAVFSEDLGLQDEQAFRDLLVMCSLRGWQSTGAFVGHQHKDKIDVTYEKVLGSPYNFFVQDEKTNLLRDIKDRKFIVGHTRYATNGKLAERNAHPFDFPNIIGVHNGVILGTVSAPYETDTEELYATMDQDGAPDALGQLWASDAFACIWYNKKEKTVNFARNDKRPLYAVWDKKGETMALASESWMLYGALGRRNIEMSEKGIHAVTPDKIFTLNITEKNFPFNMKVKDIPKMKRKVWQSNKSERVWNGGADWEGMELGNEELYSQYHEQKDRENRNKNKNKDTKLPVILQPNTHTKPAQQAPGIRKIVPYLLGFGDRKIPRETYLNQIREGCSNCGKHPDNGIFNSCVWVAPNDFICASCLSDPVIVASTKELYPSVDFTKIDHHPVG